MGVMRLGCVHAWVTDLAGACSHYLDALDLRVVHKEDTGYQTYPDFPTIICKADRLGRATFYVDCEFNEQFTAVPLLTTVPNVNG